MDAQTREALSARLVDLHERRSALSGEIRQLVAQPREGKGNPFFYSALPATDPKGKDNYTGHADDGLDVILEFRRVQKEITDVKRQLAG